MITNLSELYFIIKTFILLVQTESDFYELWPQYRLLKTMDLNEAWPYIFNEGYVHQFQPEPIDKIH